MIEDVHLGRFLEVATTSNRYVNGIILHHFKSEILEDYTGDFVLIESMIIGEIEQKTNISFEKVDDFDSYIIAIDKSA